MGRVSKVIILESVTELENLFKTHKNFKIRQRIKSLIYTKEQKFTTQKALAEFLDIDYATLKRWFKKYKVNGINSLLKLESGGNYKGVISKELHLSLEQKLNDSNNPLLGYWHAVQWVKDTHNQDIHYQTLRGYLIRHFQSKKKHPRKSHYKKDEQALEVFKKTS